MKLSPEQILVGLGAVLAAWYLIASIYNRRRGIATYRWLRNGLDVLGDKHEGKWLGSAASGAHLTVAKPKSPFRRVELIFLLESRELLPLWVVDLIRNKRDQVIFKATTRAALQARIEIAPASSRIARRIKTQIDENWTSQVLDGFFVTSRGHDATAALAALKPVLDQYGTQLRHISWSTDRPNIIAIFHLPGLLESGDSASELFRCIRDGVASA